MAPTREPVIRQTKETRSRTASWNRGERDNGVRLKVMHARNIARPQLKFKEKVDNSNTPFLHRLTRQPNCLPSDGEEEGRDAMIDKVVKRLRGEEGVACESGYVYESQTHPYEREIRQCRPSEKELQPTEIKVSLLI